MYTYVQRISHRVVGPATGRAREENTVVTGGCCAAVIRLRLIVGLLSVCYRGCCRKDMPAVPTVLLYMSWLPA